MSEQPIVSETGVAIFAPTGRDGTLMADVLARTNISASIAKDSQSLKELIKNGVGAVVVTEEALYGPGLEDLCEVLSHQPPWSDLPVILLTTSHEARSNETWSLVRKLGPAGNVILLERPLRSITLASAVEVALRSRRRQYEARSLYEDLERRVEERNAELIAKNLELEGFTYSISHDMRAPLRAIVSRASIVLEEESKALSEDGVQNLQRLAKAANNMAALVDDLLRYARIGMQQVSRERIDLESLGRDLADEIADEEATCSFTFKLTAGSWVDCDARLIGMALRNLFENACKYRAHEKHAHVEFGSLTIGDERAFYVRDSGIGFDMIYVDKLFKPFERLHREEYAGTGIGLANVRRAIERHGGRVWAESVLGQGSTFYFTIP